MIQNIIGLCLLTSVSFFFLCERYSKNVSYCHIFYCVTSKNADIFEHSFAEERFLLAENTFFSFCEQNIYRERNFFTFTFFSCEPNTFVSCKLNFAYCPHCFKFFFNSISFHDKERSIDLLLDSTISPKKENLNGVTIVIWTMSIGRTQNRMV